MSYLKKLDPTLLLPVVFLSAISLIVILSVAPRLFSQQLISFLIGWLIVVALAAIDVRPIFRHRAVVIGIYLVSIALLVATFFLAPAIRHTRSWLVVGPVQFQTSEFAKAALIIMLAYFFAKRHIGIAHFKNIIIPLFYLSIPVAFILKQPDLGSALIIIGLLIGFLFVSGLRPRHIALGLLAVVLISIWAWSSFLKPYQKERVIGLFYPERDPLGVSYNVIQSKIAIGSAGFWGKGFGQGTQVQLGFLPEPQSDFIYAAVVEEWGLLGGILVIGSLSMLLLRISWIGLEARDNFSKLICLGTAIVLLLHFVFNIGSTIGFLPVVGVPFPFLSYGGSNLLVNFLLLGMIQSIAIRANF